MDYLPKFFALQMIDEKSPHGRAVPLQALARMRGADGETLGFFFAPAHCTSIEVLGEPTEAETQNLKNYVKWLELNVFKDSGGLMERVLNGA